MKKLNLILLFVLGTLVMTITSCKKKYSGCCKYSVIFTDQTQYTNLYEDQCYSDVDKSTIDPLVSKYTYFKDKQYNTAGSYFVYTFIDNGCSFHK